MLDIVDIVFDASFEGSIPAPAVDLCPAGHARFDFVPEHVFGNRFSELVDKRRTLGTRPDEAHLAAQNIDQLWQLIQYPNQVTRESLRVAHTGPVDFSASSTIVRNLSIWNLLPSSPMRSCL